MNQHVTNLFHKYLLVSVLINVFSNQLPALLASNGSGVTAVGSDRNID